jgi:hypothetical protein
LIDRLLVVPLFADRLQPDRIGLVGHSMSGEGVVATQALNRRRNDPYGIRGIVSIAPTNWRPDLTSTHAAYLQLFGSQDYLLGDPSLVTGTDPSFGGGFRLYDRAWRHRTHAFIAGAGHDGFNSVWINSSFSPDRNDPPELPIEEQRRIGQALITAFFFDTLLHRSGFRSYLAGALPLPGVGAADVRLQHQSSSVDVIDDFGDADSQLGLPAELPPDKTRNRRRQPVTVTGSGLDRWEDVEHEEMERSVHDTRGVDIAWSGDDVVYETRLGSLAARPSDVLSLRVAQHFAEDGDRPDETWNPIGRSITFLVELHDGRQRATVALGPTNDVPYPLPHAGPYSVFRTVRLRLDEFTAVNAALDLRSLDAIRLRFSRSETGRLLIDDIEFDRAPPALVSVAEGKVASLRVHREVGFGPPHDHLKVHVVAQLDHAPNITLGFPLRADDSDYRMHEGWLELLRSAFTSEERVRVEYELRGSRNQWVRNVEVVT